MTLSRSQRQSGFTLIELMIVIALIAMLSSIALPRLMPLLVLTNHESGASKMVGFGRTAMSHAALAHTSVFVLIDLDKQEYWAEILPEAAATVDTFDTYEEEQEQEEEEREDFMPTNDAELLESSKHILELRMEERLKERRDYTPASDEEKEEYTGPEVPDNEEQQDEILAEQTKTMMERFAISIRTSVSAQASRIEHEETYDLILATNEDSVYREPDEDELLDEEGEQLSRQELDEPFLERAKISKPLFLESIVMGKNEYTEGTVEIEISPLGLNTPVEFYLASDDGELYVIHWDPITSNAWYEPEWDESS